MGPDQVGYDAVVPLRNQALVRNNAHVAKEIITARQQNAKMKKDLAHKDQVVMAQLPVATTGMVAWAWHVSQHRRGKYGPSILQSSTSSIVH